MNTSTIYFPSGYINIKVIKKTLSHKQYSNTTIEPLPPTSNVHPSQYNHLVGLCVSVWVTWLLLSWHLTTLGAWFIVYCSCCCWCVTIFRFTTLLSLYTHRRRFNVIHSLCQNVCITEKQASETPASTSEWICNGMSFCPVCCTPMVSIFTWSQRWKYQFEHLLAASSWYWKCATLWLKHAFTGQHTSRIEKKDRFSWELNRPLMRHRY